jgi:hypothetical protein
VEQKGIIRQYDENGYKAYEEWYKKGKLKTKTTFSNKADGNPLLVEKTNADGEILMKSVWTYNPDGFVSESILYKKGGTEMKNKWAYEYFYKGRLSKTILYKGNGKVKKIWSYNCKEEGQKLEKRKNETQVCTWDQSSADYLLKVFQTFDEKGNVVKNVYKYTVRDTLILEYCRYDEKDRLVVKETFNKDFKLGLTRARYKKNGKQLWEVVNTYQNDSLLVSTVTSHKGKTDGKTEYVYNEKQLLTEMKQYNRRNKPWYTVSLAYVKRD